MLCSQRNNHMRLVKRVCIYMFKLCNNNNCHPFSDMIDTSMLELFILFFVDPKSLLKCCNRVILNIRYEKFETIFCVKIKCHLIFKKNRFSWFFKTRPGSYNENVCDADIVLWLKKIFLFFFFFGVKHG